MSFNPLEELERMCRISGDLQLQLHPGGVYVIRRSHRTQQVKTLFIRWDVLDVIESFDALGRVLQRVLNPIPRDDSVEVTQEDYVA